MPAQKNGARGDRVRWAIGGIVAAVLALAQPALAQCEPTPVERHGALSVRDGRIVDELAAPGADEILDHVKALAAV